jgi:Flp pilus assembly protein TadG
MNTDPKIITARPTGKIRSSFIRRAIGRAFVDQRGQTLPIMAIMMVILLGVSALAIDVGHAYVVKSQLQNSANAAALAAAGYVYASSSSSTTSTTVADQYSSNGTENANPYNTGTPTVQMVCLNMLEPSGTTCSTTSTPNAVRVTETGTVKTFFGFLVGFPTLSVSATATASMLGSQAEPWNVAIVLDSTGSMNNADPNCGSGMTEFGCATSAIQAMLSEVDPCQTGYSSCATSNANLRVALFSFPGISTSTVTNDTSSCTTPGFMAYTLPSATNSSYTPLSYAESNGQGSTTTWSATYQIVPFSSDYWSSTASNHLNPSSALVNTISGCMSPISQGNNATGGLNGAPGNTNGGVTYSASPIYAAQAAMIAEQKTYPGTQNAIIVLSDGQDNMPAGADDFPSEQNATLASGTGYSAPTGTGLYPDINDECQQAILAAQAATAAGTRVYAVSYGSESEGCSYTVGTKGTSGSYGTDNTTVATGANATFTAATITPCVSMENIASSLQYFYSDYNQTDAGTGVDKNCIDNAHSVSDLKDILLAVGADFTRPRLLPSNAPYTVIPQ